LPTLDVPGATLYYERDGTGPVLLLIPGGPADAGIFAALRDVLSDRYTVVPYDPRGNSRSVPDDPSRGQDLDVHGDDAAKAWAGIEETYQAYCTQGVEAGLKRFEAAIGMEDAPPEQAPGEPTPETLEAWGRIGGNVEYFLAHGVRQLSGYAPDVAALRAGPARIVVGVGESSAGQLAHRAAVALAERLGTPPVTFPGDHGGFGSRPARFAETLDRVLRG
jgi:hypothetical protein